MLMGAPSVTKATGLTAEYLIPPAPQLLVTLAGTTFNWTGAANDPLAT